MIQTSLVYCFPEQSPDDLAKLTADRQCTIFYGFSDSIDNGFLETLRANLNEREAERAGKFHFRNDEVNYIACRAIARSIAGKRLGCAPSQVDIRVSVNDKPFIPGHPVYFNIAHSYNIFGVAFSETSAVGIDFEKMKDNFDYKRIVSNYFSDDEQKSIQNAGENSLKRFFLYWTRKEALLKAMGLGITQDLTRIEVLDAENRVTIKDAGISTDPYYFVYSAILDNYYLSLALSGKSRFSLKKVKSPEDFNKIIL